MTTCFLDGFEEQLVPSNVPGNYNSVSNTGNMSIDTAVFRSGLASLKVSCTTSATTYAEAGRVSTAGSARGNPINTRHAWFRLGIYVQTLPASGSEAFISGVDASNAKKWGFHVRSDGKIEAFDSGGTSRGTSTTALSINTWYLIEGFAASFTSVMEIKINGTREISTVAASLLNGNLYYMRFGKPYNTSSQTFVYNIDDFVIDDGKYPGNGGVYLCKVNANTTDAAWSGGTSTSDYTQLTDVPEDGDTSYIGITTTGRSLFTCDTSGLPANKVVNGIKVSAFLKESGGSTNTSVKMSLSGNLVSTDTFVLSTSYAQIDLLFPGVPITGKRWTYSDLASLKIGVDQASAATVRCTAVYLQVDVVTAPTAFTGIKKKTGNFTITSTGFQQITGLGFKPKVIILVGAQLSAGALDTRVNDWRNSFGIVDFDRGGMNQFGDVRPDAQGTSSLGFIYGPFVHYFTTDPAGAGSNLSYVTDRDDDSFWVATEVKNENVRLHYIALGGDDLIAEVINFTTNNSTGNQAIATGTFTPQALLFFTGDNGGNGPQNSIGGAVSTSQRWASQSYMANGVGTSDQKERQRTDRCFIRSEGSLQVEADLISMDARGFTFNIPTSPSAAWNYSVLSLRGAQFAMGSFNQPAATGDQSVTGVGFKPEALFVVGGGHAASTSQQSDAYRSIGFAGGTSDRFAVGMSGANGLATTQQDSYYSASKVYTALLKGATATVPAIADHKSFDADGFTWTWSAADATARQILYLAIATNVPVHTFTGFGRRGRFYFS